MWCGPSVFLHLDRLPIVHSPLNDSSPEALNSQTQSLAGPHMAESVDFSAPQRQMHPVGSGHGAQRQTDIRVTPTTVLGVQAHLPPGSSQTEGSCSGQVRHLSVGGPLEVYAC